MRRDFDEWNELKIELHAGKIPSDFQFKEREIWTCHVGLNIGVEQNGQGVYFSRPILIFKIFNSEMFWGIPITTKFHTGPGYFAFNLGGADQFAILSQMRLFSSKRLERFLAVMSDSMFTELLCGFKKILP